MSQLLPESRLRPASLRPVPRDAPAKAPYSMRPRPVAWVSVALIACTFVESILRLGSRAVSTVQAGLSPGQWLALIAIVAGFVYIEGHRALEGKFAPLVVSRALELGSRNLGTYAALSAPLYSLSLIGAPRRALLRAWLAVGLIVIAILVVRALPSPWRGIIDAGVAAALAWGLGALVVEFSRRLRA